MMAGKAKVKTPTFRVIHYDEFVVAIVYSKFFINKLAGGMDTFIEGLKIAKLLSYTEGFAYLNPLRIETGTDHYIFVLGDDHVVASQ
jgi:hypothetical protein